LLNVPPSCACALVLALRTGPLPLLRLVRLCALPSAAAALPPLPIEEPVPDGPVDVPPVPTVEAEVPPAAAEPPLPVMLLWANTGVTNAAEAIRTEANKDFDIRNLSVGNPTIRGNSR